MESKSNKIAVVYKSKYGSTKRYAQWLAEEVQADIFESSKISVGDLLKYDTIVYGGSLYATGILGFSLIKKNYDKIKDKHLIVFSVGASPAHPEAIESVINSNFTLEMKEKINFFHLRGGLNYARMNPLDKLLMYFLKKRIEHKKAEERTDDEKGILASYNHAVDFTNENALIPLVECIMKSK